MEVEIMTSVEKDGMKLYGQLEQFAVTESIRLRASMEDFASIGLWGTLQAFAMGRLWLSF
jgi:hypothetical protein